jgi:hypothetical protein
MHNVKHKAAFHVYTCTCFETESTDKELCRTDQRFLTILRLSNLALVIYLYFFSKLPYLSPPDSK